MPWQWSMFFFCFFHGFFREWFSEVSFQKMEEHVDQWPGRLSKWEGQEILISWSVYTLWNLDSPKETKKLLNIQGFFARFGGFFAAFFGRGGTFTTSISKSIATSRIRFPYFEDHTVVAFFCPRGVLWSLLNIIVGEPKKPL